MVLIRSAERHDFSALLRLARILDSYNLPADPKFLRALLQDSEKSFAGKISSSEKTKFLFVAEEIKSRKVVGCSLILGRHGTPALPHLAFNLGRDVKKSRTLSKKVEQTTLQLVSDPQGYTEIGGLVVLPAYRRRKEKIGKQLSYARFAYMASHRSQFRRKLLVEYLPKLNHLTGNKLWKALGQKFTQMTYHEADRLSVTNKEFILSLFPKEKIYSVLLPESVTKDLGCPGIGAEISRRLLNKIGFKFLNQIDPFDGGPHYGARLSDISLVRKTKVCKWSGRLVPGSEGAWLQSRSMVMVERKGKVRAVLVPVLSLSKDWLQFLRKGDKVSTTPFDL